MNFIKKLKNKIMINFFLSVQNTETPMNNALYYKAHFLNISLNNFTFNDEWLVHCILKSQIK